MRNPYAFHYETKIGIIFLFSKTIFRIFSSKNGCFQANALHDEAVNTKMRFRIGDSSWNYRKVFVVGKANAARKKMAVTVQKALSNV